MIQQLKAAQFKNVKALVNGNYKSVQLQTVINGTNRGFIFADSLDSPKSALVFHQGEGGFFFIGNPYNQIFMNELVSFIKTNLAEKLKEMGINTFEFSGDSVQWDTELRGLFKDFNVWESTQRIYMLENPVTMSNSLLADGIEICGLTNELAESITISNVSFIKDIVEDWFFSWEDFIKQGGGFAAMKKDVIIGRCLLDGKMDSVMAIGIKVQEEYRRKGIAFALASEMVNSIIKSGYIPYWECSDGNLPSIKLAEKCGLKLNSSYQLFGFNL